MKLVRSLGARKAVYKGGTSGESWKSFATRYSDAPPLLRAAMNP